MFLSSEKIKYNISTNESRILMFTSSFTIIPIYIAYNRGLYYHAITSYGSMFFSILYWYHPIHCWRRDLDILYAKYAFLVYLISGLLFLPPGLCSFLFYIGTFSLIRCYLMTMKYPEKWIYYHILFHVISILTKIHILSYHRL